MMKAQLLVFVYFLPSAVIFGIPYYMLWSDTFSKDAFHNSISFPGGWSTPAVIAVIMSAIVAHELLHGFTWGAFAEGGLKSIRYGVAWKFLTPYCHCTEPLTVKHYIAGAAMPGIILGVLPAIVSIITGNIVLFVFGMFMIFSAGGDFMIINKLRREGSGNFVQDHPSKIGCFIFRPEQQ